MANGGIDKYLFFIESLNFVKFQLVCENAWQADLNQAFLNVGLLLGALVIGYGADR